MIDAEVLSLDRRVEASETVNVDAVSDEDIIDDDDYDVLMAPLENEEDDDNINDDEDQGSPPPKKTKLATITTDKPAPLKRANAMAKNGSNTVTNTSSLAKTVRTIPPAVTAPKAIIRPKKIVPVTRIPKKNKK